MTTTRTKTRLIVAGGVITDPLAQVAANLYWLVTPVSDPYWSQWQAEGAPTTEYIPFQTESNHEVLPAEYRSDWIGV